MTQTSITSTSGRASREQLRQIQQILLDAVRKGMKKIPFTEEESLRILSTGKIPRKTLQLISDLRHQFSDEEVPPCLGYGTHFEIGTPQSQVDNLKRWFPNLKDPQFDVSDKFTLPEEADGWIALPRWEKIEPEYTRAITTVFDALSQFRGALGSEGIEKMIHPDRLRQHERKTTFMEKLIRSTDQQDEDIIVLPAQFGFRHRGRSMRRACEVFKHYEFGFGIFEISCTFLMRIDPFDKVRGEDTITIDLPGDYFEKGGNFTLKSPHVNVHDELITFYSESVGSVDESSGSVTGFIPKRKRS